jgi:hypothetical protein
MSTCLRGRILILHCNKDLMLNFAPQSECIWTKLFPGKHCHKPMNAGREPAI